MATGLDGYRDIFLKGENRFMGKRILAAASNSSDTESTVFQAKVTRRFIEEAGLTHWAMSIPERKDRMPR